MFSCSAVSHSLQLHGLQQARFPCPSLSPRVCSDSCPLIPWWYPTISSSAIPFCSCPQSFPSGSFPMSQLFTSHGQSIGASASASVLPMNIKGCFPLGWTCLISLLSAGNTILIVFGRAIFPEVEKWLNSNKKSVSSSCSEYTERRLWHKFNWEFWWTQIKSDTYVCAQPYPTLLQSQWTVAHQVPLSMEPSRQEY